MSAAANRIDLNPSRNNPLAVRLHLVTVVTPDMAASLAFYCDLLDYELIQKGLLDAGSPSPSGLSLSGRAYALLRQRTQHGEPGIIRLLEASAGAIPNRPRPESSILDTGLAALELATADEGRAYRRLTAAGIEALSWPQYYRHDASRPGPTGQLRSVSGGLEFKTFCVFGPAGEQLLIHRELSCDGVARPDWHEPHSDYSGGTAVLLTRDRWPMMDFYGKVFGLKPSKHDYLQQAPLNVALGAPPDTYFYFGALGEGVNCQWREYRSTAPTAEPPYPTQLDRTGLAMLTLTVSDLNQVRANAQAGGVSILGAGALPTIQARHQEGIYLRGWEGELIEVIGRAAGDRS